MAISEIKADMQNQENKMNPRQMQLQNQANNN